MEYILSFIQSLPHLKVLGILCVAIVVVEIVIYRYRSNVQREYKDKKPDILSSEEAERASLQYFSKLHLVDLIRTGYFIVSISVIIALYDIRALSFFAVAVGAIIIALRDSIVSCIAFPYVVFTYDIGDTIKVNNLFGEIVRVNLLTTRLAGKDEQGEHNGKLHIVPNARFLLESVEKQEIKNKSYRKIELHPVYRRDEQELSFTLWLERLKVELTKILSKRSLKEVGNFKSYAGMRYKLHYDYNEDGDVVVHVSFISSSKSYFEKKEAIIMYLESLKKERMEKKDN